MSVWSGGQTVFARGLARPVELGRQRVGEPGAYTLLESSDGDRLIVADLGESTISRRHVRVTPLSARRVRITNLSAVNTIWLDTSRPLAPQADAETDAPVTLTLGNADLTVVISVSLGQDEGLQSLAHPAAIPGVESVQGLASLERVLRVEQAEGMSRRVLGWLRNTMQVFESAASSPEFLDKAARAVLEVSGFDHAGVLFCRNGRWQIAAAVHLDVSSAIGWTPSQSLLERVRRHKRTFWKTPYPEASIQGQESLLALDAYVASPILDTAGNPIGALYGERSITGHATHRAPISELDAMMIELLSYSVASGLARVEQEKAALEARVLFEQFFTPELSRQLQADPTLLSGKDASVTVLFCDIRGFSRISERIGAALTFDWINAVMGTLSDCVLEHHGVLVDYIGDELVAMWGAPQPCTDHPIHACRAAVDMLTRRDVLSDQWRDVIGEATSYCIGINTGPARVGNTGSKRKFKYGPLGNTVNLASRVQGATKFVRRPLVVSEATARCLDEEFATRRLCRVELVNIAEPVVLYELSGRAEQSWHDLRDRYESALDAFERGDFAVATRILGNLLTDYPDDGPTVLLLARTVELLAQPTADFSPVWKLSSK